MNGPQVRLNVGFDRKRDGHIVFEGKHRRPPVRPPLPQEIELWNLLNEERNEHRGAQLSPFRYTPSC